MSTLATFLSTTDKPLTGVLEVFAESCAQLADYLAKPRIHTKADTEQATAKSLNASGDEQHTLDAYSHNLFAAAFAQAQVAWLASEEEDGARALCAFDAQKKQFALALDPLDGSSNIDTNSCIGSILSVYPAAADAVTTFTQSGTKQLAAAVVVYGPCTQLWLTLGKGTVLFVLDRDAFRQGSILDAFVCVNTQVAIAPNTSEFAINASNLRHWPAPVRHHIEMCQKGVDGEYKRNFNMRWLASMVGEAARIFQRGGIFWYPADSRKGYRQGRLRMLYEALPIALLIEQAGGSAYNEQGRLLAQHAASLHQRTGLLFGSKNEADFAWQQLNTKAGVAQRQPLFGARTLLKPDFSN